MSGLVIVVREAFRVVPKHVYKGSAIAEAGGEGAEAGIEPQVELTSEGDDNA